MNRPFRSRDRVTVHLGNGRTARGRVICHNRKNKYDLSLIVLVEDEEGWERPESFLADGHRWTTRDGCYITHGWEEDA